ncbi:hypothetical protein CYMTET_46210 [Cymbomonas tetramitiformis]|uniref:Uncharacterized protein n=1 Tax=Cymbomonas tetramitiformis TaxID=36881 RepID=A0AAE0BYN5_9CHLO|nr:hypothetical protein CYMTET_46210 [Cymbomonas tetramitiformis]
MFGPPCSDGESELSASSCSSGSEEYFYETAEDFLSKKKTANKPRKTKKSDLNGEPKTSGYGPNNTEESLKQIPSLMDPANDCKCGRRCLPQFEYRPLQGYLREKSKLDSKASKDKILAELIAVLLGSSSLAPASLKYNRSLGSPSSANVFARMRIADCTLF